MKAYIWENDVTSAYGENGFVLVVANSMKKAMGVLARCHASAPQMLPDDGQGYNGPAQQGNRRLAEEFARKWAAVSGRHQPPTDFGSRVRIRGMNRLGLGHTRIPYAIKDGRRGYLWPIATGCAHGTDVCATRDTCWARTQVHRNLPGMKEHYNPDFSPKVNVDLLLTARFPKKPSLILVAFTGELFGDWVPASVQLAPLLAADALPQHTFVFLTKAAHNLHLLNPWPDNAWVGVSITGAEPPEVQKARYNALLAVEAKHRWLSYEPTLGPLALHEFPGLSWLVIGGQSGKGAVKPNPMWVADAEATAIEAGIPVYIKPALSRALGRRQMMELPWPA